MPVATTTVLAIGAFAVGAAGAYSAYRQQKAARADQQAAAQQQEAARAEETAGNAQQAAIANRQRIREERVKRAQIIAASEAGGTGGSSGEMGALGGMATQFASAAGESAGMFARGQRISMFGQTAANFMTASQTHMNKAGLWGQVSNLGFNLFGMSMNAQQAQNAKLQKLGLAGA